jgi:hypothetical protein
MNLKILGIAGAVAAMAAVPALAHHSFAMFDATATKNLDGTVKEFQWTNPHAWIMLTDGNNEVWAVEMGGPAGLARQGWRPKTLTPGMPVKLTIHPLKDGTNGGQFISASLPDGTKLGAGAGQVAAPGQENSRETNN